MLDLVDLNTRFYSTQTILENEVIYITRVFLEGQ
jgi:hypothetical protein